MIAGYFSKQGVPANSTAVDRMLTTAGEGRPSDVAVQGAVALGCVAEGSETRARRKAVLSGPMGQGQYAVWQGEIYNRSELLRELDVSGAEATHLNDADILLRLYGVHGVSGVARINGSFAFALGDAARHQVILGRDRFGVETLYYYDGPHALVFSTRPRSLLAHPHVAADLNEQALQRFLVFGFNPASDTFFRGVRKLRPARLLVSTDTQLQERRYWHLSFREVRERAVPEYCRDILDLVVDSIRLRLTDSGSLGIFLSGGMDSSTVAGLTRRVSDTDLVTFSYRCLGRSFDESHHARAMAQHCGATHHEIVFQPADIRRMESMVRLMDEPLCNAAITVATFLLGGEAEGKVDRVFSGDGGDELFGGHPVYAADRIGASFDKIPLIVRRPLLGLLSYLPDSDKKLNLTVKLKRFAESVGYPGDLGTYRWRIQYGPAELAHVLLNGARLRVNETDLFQEIRELVEEADGPDMLSRSLYVDTITEVGFYLRRMDLVRAFGVTPVFPLLDHRLVEYAASIPSHLKFRNASETKYIQHRTMEGVLPDQIVHRKDKLGHSIPLKNWLRTDPTVKAFVRDTLFDSARRTRDVVDISYVERLWGDHQSYRRNNSHRLWTLTVLELWMRANGL
jgi:asparagine synthase (glutamine-hydrolysing)